MLRHSKFSRYVISWPGNSCHYLPVKLRSLIKFTGPFLWVNNSTREYSRLWWSGKILCYWFKRNFIFFLVFRTTLDIYISVYPFSSLESEELFYQPVWISKELNNLSYLANYAWTFKPYIVSRIEIQLPVLSMRMFNFFGGEKIHK